MTIHVDKPAGAPETVTTGPMQGSNRVFSSPQGRPDISVPFREVALSDPLEPPVRLYDTSGPYTDALGDHRPRQGRAAGARALDRQAWLRDDRGPRP